MIRAVIFDCFGVLYADPGLLFYEANVPNYAELRPEMMQIDKQCDIGLINQEEHNRAIAELTGLSYELIKEGVQGRHARNESLLTYSQSLRPKYKLGMLSNIGTGSMESFFNTDERQKLFDASVLSSDVGMIKPSAEIFHETALRLGVEASECIMVDDRQDNCAGADAAGMPSILHTDNKTTIEAINALLESGNA